MNIRWDYLLIPSFVVSFVLLASSQLTFRGSVAHGPEKLIKLPIRMLAIIIYDDEMARLVI